MSRVFKDTVVTQSLPEAMLEHFEKAIVSPNVAENVRDSYDFTYSVNAASISDFLLRKYHEINKYFNRREAANKTIEELKEIESFVEARLKAIVANRFDSETEINTINTFIGQLKDENLLAKSYPEFNGIFMPAGVPSF